MLFFDDVVGDPLGVLDELQGRLGLPYHDFEPQLRRRKGRYDVAPLRTSLWDHALDALRPRRHRDAERPPPMAKATRAKFKRRVLLCWHGGVVGGQRVRVVGLREAAAYNGALGVAIAFAEARWRVRLPDGSLKSLRPENVESAEPRAFAGRVLVFWGDSRWSRTQLLGGLARRQWCVARATCEDVLAADRHARLVARGVSAAESEMADPGL